MMKDLNPDLPSPPECDELEDALEKLMAARAAGEPLLYRTAGLTPAAGRAATPCAPPEEWLRLASGEMDEAAAASLLSHAAMCQDCGKHLRLGLQICSGDVAGEEADGPGAPDPASDEWRRRLAKTLAKTPRHGVGARGRAWLWVGSGVAASLLLAVALVWWQRANSPARLLALAYGESRIFDLRMPDAKFSPVHPAIHIRGASEGRERAPLLEARARIERHLERAPNDPYWLQLQARADVMEEDFDPAIDILDRLLAAGPLTSALLADDAAAYFERGEATGSENDRATALDYLRRADELAPDDPVLLFNEAVVMEDRGQVMNAVETWSRYLRFERDPRWLAEGRARMEALEQKLNRMKTHEGRMEQHLASPQAMRALAADSGELAAIDEELSSTLLPRILYAAFPVPADRARGSPCDNSCQAARILLRSLANSLESRHRDPWLNRFLPSDSSPPTLQFMRAARVLAGAIDADALADYATGQKRALQSSQLFTRIGNAAGRDRADVERIYALHLSFNYAQCHRAAQLLLRRDPEFAWIQISAGTQESVCYGGPGSAAENAPALQRVLRLAQDHRYSLLELRVRTMQLGGAVESGDSEEAWQVDLATIRRFYAGDYPALRIYNLIGMLAQIEEATPRVHLALLLEQEQSQILELTEKREMIPAQRMYLAAAAIRAGAVAQAREQMRMVQAELARDGGGKPIRGELAENEIAMASYYMDRPDLAKAAEALDAARVHLTGDDDFVHRRSYAAARGQLELALGHAEAAQSTLQEAILDEERQAGKGGPENVVFALRDRDLYAALAAVWLAQGRSGEEVLALWERYRLRILGAPVPVCQGKSLDCLEPMLIDALKHLGHDRVLGQVVLLDRVLVYRAGAQGVAWNSIPVGRDDLLQAAGTLERAASSPATSPDSVDQAARRVGEILFRGPADLSGADGQILLEADPILGNLPWAAVQASGEPIGLRFNLEEAPSLLLGTGSAEVRRAAGNPLIVGASISQGDAPSLPEVLSEAEAVARFAPAPDLLLASDATETHVAAGIGTAPFVHFAGHATRYAGSTRLLLTPIGIPPNGGDYIDSGFLRRHPPRAARLVVFSACSSGKREEGWNHDMRDIVDTLAALGVPEVVATRWQIDSASAIPMMAAFYGGLARGFTVPQSLTLARQSLIRDPRYRHPYYWAAYYASGMGSTDLREVFHASNR